MTKHFIQFVEDLQLWTLQVNSLVYKLSYKVSILQQTCQSESCPQMGQATEYHV